jgi:hypothetical protein
MRMPFGLRDLVGQELLLVGLLLGPRGQQDLDDLGEALIRSEVQGGGPRAVGYVGVGARIVELVDAVARAVSKKYGHYLHFPLPACLHQWCVPCLIVAAL